jgi:hypothetical protein
LGLDVAEIYVVWHPDHVLDILKLDCQVEVDPTDQVWAHVRVSLKNDAVVSRPSRLDISKIDPRQRYFESLWKDSEIVLIRERRGVVGPT